jgi:hypothetical protein
MFKRRFSKRAKRKRQPTRPPVNRVNWKIVVAALAVLLISAVLGSLPRRDVAPGIENVTIQSAPGNGHRLVSRAASTSSPKSTVNDAVLATVPGLADRTEHAPLADLFAKADPSADAQWLSEQFSEIAGQQLKALAELSDQRESLRPDSLAALVSQNYLATTLRPATDRVFRDDALSVERQIEATNANIVGHAGFIQDFRDLLSIYASGQDNHVHMKFKIVRAEIAEGNFSTTAYVEIYGRSETQPARLSQQTATWRCQWVRQEGGDMPLLHQIEVSDYEEVVPTGERSSVFVDCTDELLGENSTYTDQLAYGSDHWYGNLDVAFGIHQGNQGLAVGDANGDGREDLFVCQPAGLPNRLYIQQTDGTLVDRSEECGVDWLDASRSALFVDLDNDGDQDLAVTLNYSLVIFENLGVGQFDKRTRVDIYSWPSSIAAADYDNDGDLDIYICGYNPRGETAPGDIFANPVPYHDANNGARNFMMRNNGNWDFLDVTQAVGLDQNNRRFTFAAMWEDYDNDGDVDLYVANDFGRNNLYRNDVDANGNRRFVDCAHQAGVEDIAAGMSVSWGDYNQDGWMDLYVSNMFSSAGNRITTQKQFQADADGQTRQNMQRHARGNSLFENQRDGTFQDVSVEAAVTMGRWAWGSLFTDINNDGWEDLVVANGFFTTPDTGDL